MRLIKMISVSAVVLGFGVLSAQAALITLDTKNNGEDCYIREDNGGTANVNPILLRSRNITGSVRHQVGLFKFDLTSVTETVTNAAFKFTVTTGDSDSFSLDVFGVVDNATYEDWDAATATYYNAPFIDGDAADALTVDRDHLAGATTLLGSIAYTGTTTGEITFSNSNLVDFLNADSNSEVSFLIETAVAGTGGDYLLYVASDEAGSGYPGLNISTIPEPATFGLMGLALTALFGLRRVLA
jgi:hypothetical protein